MEKGTRTPKQARQVPIVWSGGTDGVISPHATIFATVPADVAERSDQPRVAVGYAMSEPIRPEEIGRRGMIEKVATAVRAAMDKAGITDSARRALRPDQDATADDPHDPRREGPWPDRVDRAHARVDGPSNGCTALGVAVALGEIEMPDDSAVMHDRSLYSAVASCSSGVELDQAQVVVVGNVGESAAVTASATR